MNSFFVPTFTVLQWVILGLIPPLVFLLYFLKLRRQPVEVPSTYLWARTIEDLHVNSIWQRLRNNLLLWLQLLLGFLLLLCGLRPGCPGEELQGERFIFLIDNSASMAAVEDGESRLEKAKEHVKNLIDVMSPGDAAMVISFSDQAFAVQSYTTNKSLLKRRVEAIRQSQRRTDLNEALKTASGLANPGRTSNREDSRDYQVADAREAKLFIVSDGGVLDVPDFNMVGLEPEYHAIGGPEDPENVAIVAFSVTTNSDEKELYQAYGRLENFTNEAKTVSVSLYANDELFDSQKGIEIKSNAATGISFDLTEALDKYTLPINLRLEIEDKDVLDIDNRAYAILNRPRQARILVLTDGNRFLEFGMQTEQNLKTSVIEFEPPSFLEGEVYANAMTEGTYDLIVFDRCAPKENPACNTFYINAVPPGDRWAISDPFNPVSILDYNRSHPVTQYIVLRDLVIVEARSLTNTPSATIPLIETTEGPLMAIGPRDGFQDLLLAMSIVDTADDGTDQLNTDWPNDLSFPLIMQNIVSYLGGSSEIKTDQKIQTGDIVLLKVEEAFDSIDVKQPAGDKTNVTRNPNNVFVYGNTNQIGVYEISGKDKNDVSQSFAVNLMDRRESNVRVREKLEIGFEEIENSQNRKRVRKEWWKWLVILALVVLVVEWVIYNRRVFM